jgi:hypothetical protein
LSAIKNLKHRIRGWFPKEPTLPSQNNPVRKWANPKIPQLTPMRSGNEISPYLLAIFLPIAVIINFFIGYDVVLQYFVRGIPPVSSRLDMWFTSHYFGSFNPSNYVTVLSVFYLFSLFLGTVISWALLSSIFRDLVKNSTVTFTTRRFVASLIDIFVGIVVIGFLVNPILQYASGYSASAGAISVTSTISFYIFAGFITGCILTKVLLPLKIFIRSKRLHLDLIVESLRLGSKVASKYPNAIRWTLQQKTQIFANPMRRQESDPKKDSE